MMLIIIFCCILLVVDLGLRSNHKNSLNFKSRAEVPKKEPELIINTDEFCNLLYIQYTTKLDYNNTKGIRKNRRTKS